MGGACDDEGFEVDVAGTVDIAGGDGEATAPFLSQGFGGDTIAQKEERVETSELLLV